MGWFLGMEQLGSKEETDPGSMTGKRDGRKIDWKGVDSGPVE